MLADYPNSFAGSDPEYGPVAVPEAVNENVPDCWQVVDAPPGAEKDSPLKVAGGAAAATAGIANPPKVAMVKHANTTARSLMLAPFPDPRRARNVPRPPHEDIARDPKAGRGKVRTPRPTGPGSSHASKRSRPCALALAQHDQGRTGLCTPIALCCIMQSCEYAPR